MKRILSVLTLAVCAIFMVSNASAQEYTFEEINIKGNADAMLYSNAPCTVTTWNDNFKGWYVLFDENPATIFHSEYGSGTSTDHLDHYWRVDMGDDRLSTFKFKIQTRNQNCTVNSPTTIVVEGSNEDGGNGTYTEIKTITGIPQQNSYWYESDVLGQHGIKYRYIRFRVTATGSNQTDGDSKKFFFISEFRMSKAIAPVRSDYVHKTGNMTESKGKRKLNSFTLTDGTNSLEVTNIQETSTSPVYSDKTESELRTYAGATLSFSDFIYEGSWMHAYAYVDYDKDRYFTLAKNNDGTTEGEIVSYNYYNGTTITDVLQNDGNAMEATFDGSKTLPAFTLPADLEPGEYRMRIKVDWNNLDADYGASDIAQNNGCQCDITLVIEPKSYTVTATAGTGGSASVSAATVEHGSSVTLTAEANEGYHFVNWTKDGVEVSTNANCTIENVTADAEYIANFAINTYVITATANPVTGGSTSVSAATVEHGGETILTATPNAGYYFVNWTKDDVEVSTNANYTIENVTADAEYIANFKQIVANVTLNDIQGNTYKVTLSGLTGEVNTETLAAKLKTEYPFIEEFGINPTFADNGTSYTYKNSVKLMFKVSKTTGDPKTDNLWHNIYYPSNANDNPNYIAALDEDEVVDMAASKDYAYGANPTYNTMNGNPNISWAIYNVNDSFEFILKSEHTGKYIKANNVSGETTANVSFVDNAGDATAFTLLKDAGSYNGDYALVAKVGNATGYLCATPSSTNYVTHFDHTNHQGAWVKIEETDYEGKIKALDDRLLNFYTGNDKYMLTSEIQAIIDAMGTYDNPLYRNMTLNTIEGHIATVNNKIDSWPKISLTITPENKGTTNIGGEENVVRKFVPTGDLIIEAVPVEGYHFVNWTKGTEVVSEDAEYRTTISGVKGDVTELTANFAINVYNITVTAGEGGSATASAETAEYGSEVTLTAVANDGFVFDHWELMNGSSDEGTTVSTSAVYTLTLEANPNKTVTYKAFFRQITALEDGKAYRIAGMMSDGTLRYIYRDGQNLKWSTTKNETTKSIFIAQSDFNGSLNLISAVGDYGWNYGGDLSDSYATLKTAAGSKPGTFTLYAVNGDKKRSYNAYGTSTSNDLNFNTGTDIIKENDNSNCTDMVFEEVPFAFQVSAADGSNAKLGTVNLPFATTVPEGVTAYRVVNDANGYVYVEPLELTDNVLPANTPVLIEAEEKGKYGFAPAPAAAVHETGFAGTLAAETIAATTNAYILSYDGEGTAIKFYKLSSSNRKINANKAYYVSANGNPAAFYINLGGGTTDLEEVKAENGKAEAIYDLQGRKLSEITEPGIYIVNGKKIFVK